MSPRTAPRKIALLALISALHTSVYASAQAPAPAAADAATRERARTAYGAGQDAYTAGQYAAAEAHFSQADSLLPSLQAKYWRAMSLDRLGNAASAYEAFGQILASPEKDQLGAEKLATVETRHRELAAAPASLDVTTTPTGAHVNVSGVDLASTTPLALKLAPGRHLLRVTLDGYEPQQIEITATPGARLTPSFDLVPSTSPAAIPPDPTLTPPPVEEPQPPREERSKVPGFVTLGIAGASAVVGTVFGLRALADKSKFDDAPSTSKADDVERNALIADMAFGVTLTLGITAVVLLVADDPAPEQAAASRLGDRSELRLTPFVSPNAAGAAASFRF